MFSQSTLFKISLLGATFAQAASLAAAETGAHLTQLWSVSENIKNPESTYVDPASGKIFVSNVAGGATDKDGIGWISQITVDKEGKPHASKIVEGLNAPKGLRAHKGVLYVSDIDEVVKIDIKTNKIIGKIKSPGATFLNDLAIADDGRVFVSDTIKSQIYVIEKDQASIFVSGPEFESPNGLLVIGDKLFVSGWGLVTDPATLGTKDLGHLYSIDLKTKNKSIVGKSAIGHLDGLEQAKNGDFIVSDWVAGKIFRVSKSGKVTLLEDGIKNTADIGLLGSTILVPSMSTDQVIALKP
jgi:outer membrane protein assembly factor BamB